MVIDRKRGRMRIITCKPRGCGRRKNGGVYLVSEPGKGILPLWVSIDPPIEFDGDNFRGQIQVDLELVLAGLSKEQYLLGASAERVQRENLHSPEIQAYGMLLRDRRGIGVCRARGMDALSELYPKHIGDLGLALRSLSRLGTGKGSLEVPIAFRLIQEKKYGGVLAALWRLWNACPKGQKTKAALWVRIAMISLNAPEDAMEIA